jgi:hypothetical protein
MREVDSCLLRWGYSDDCAGLPQAAVDYKVKEIDKSRARFEAEQPKYIATAVLKNKGAKTVKSLVWISIDETGKVISASAVTGHVLLRSLAVEAAKLARFAPTMVDGRPVRVTGIITYNFVAQ